jgi:hypothetical protein
MCNWPAGIGTIPAELACPTGVIRLVLDTRLADSSFVVSAPLSRFIAPWMMTRFARTPIV